MTTKLRWIILNIFDKSAHNRQYLRLCYKYLPGRIFTSWRVSDYAASQGHLYILQHLYNQGDHCTIYWMMNSKNNTPNMHNILDFLYGKLVYQIIENKCVLEPYYPPIAKLHKDIKINIKYVN